MSGRASGLLLLVVGIVLVAQAAMTGSFGFALLNLPIIGAGYAALRHSRRRWATWLAAVVAFAYAAFWLLVATTPWRMATPPPDEGRPPLDPYSVALAVTFVVALALAVIASFDHSDKRAQPDV